MLINLNKTFYENNPAIQSTYLRTITINYSLTDGMKIGLTKTLQKIIL